MNTLGIEQSPLTRRVVAVMAGAIGSAALIAGVGVENDAKAAVREPVVTDLIDNNITGDAECGATPTDSHTFTVYKSDAGEEQILIKRGSTAARGRTVSPESPVTESVPSYTEYVDIFTLPETGTVNDHELNFDFRPCQESNETTTTQLPSTTTTEAPTTSTTNPNNSTTTSTSTSSSTTSTRLPSTTTTNPNNSTTTTSNPNNSTTSTSNPNNSTTSTSTTNPNNSTTSSTSNPNSSTSTTNPNNSTTSSTSPNTATTNANTSTTNPNTATTKPNTPATTATSTTTTSVPSAGGSETSKNTSADQTSQVGGGAKGGSGTKIRVGVTE